MMKGQILARYLLLACFYLALTGTPQLFARTIYPTNLWQQVNSPAQAAHFHEAKDFASQDELAKAALRPRHELRIRQLHETANRLVAPNKVVEQKDMEAVVRFLRTAKKKVRVAMKGRRSVYIHPGQDGLIKFPVQVFDDGTTYVHLRDFDPKQKRGGYKSFSRSIDVKTGKAYASLVTAIEKRRDAEVIVDELGKMYRLRHVSSILGFHDVDSYVDHDANGRGFQHKIAFQAELYDDDLSSYARQLANDPAKLVKVAYDATAALRQLHVNGYIHRDIKPSNYFVRTVMPRFELVLADLGLAYATSIGLGMGLAGTRGYIAPETCLVRLEKGVACTNAQDAMAADVYGLGMTLLALMQEGDWGMRERTYKINLMALPKDNGAPGTAAGVRDALRELKKYHDEQMRRYLARGSVHNRQLHELRQVVWQMVDPDPKLRPGLDKVLRLLTPLLREQGGNVAA